MKSLSLLVATLMSCVVFAQENPVLVVSGGHHQSISSVDFSPNGRHLASGGSDNLVKVYDMRLQRELNTFTGHSDKVLKVFFSDDGKHLISVGKKEILVHTHPAGELVQQINLKTSFVDFECQITSDKRLYYSDRKGLKIYNALTGELEKTFEELKFTGFTILPDEKTLIGTAKKETGEMGVGFYSIPDGALTDFILIEDMALTAGRYSASANGKKVVFDIKKGEVGILDVKSKSVAQRINIGPMLQNILKLSPKGKQLVTSSYDNYVRFWDTGTGKKINEIKDLSPSGEATSMSLGVMDMDFSDDGKMAVFAYQDLKNLHSYYTVEWFNAKTMETIGNHAGEVKISLSISVDPSGKILSTGTITDAMGVKCLDLVKGSQKAFIPGTAYLGSGGKYLAAVNTGDNNDYKLEIYKMPAVRLTKTFDLFGFSIIDMAPSGAYVSAIDQKHTPNSDPMKPQVTPHVRVWNISTGEEVVTIEKSLMDMPRKCIFTQDDKHVLVLYVDRIEMIDLATGDLVKTTPAKLSLDYNNVLSPDGQMVVGTSFEGVYGINFTTGERKVLMSFDRKLLPMSLKFSPDNTMMAMACLKFGVDKPNRVLVFDWATKEQVCELVGHTTYARQLTFGPENKHLYSVDDNGIIIMWNLENCLPKASFLAFGAEDYLIISPDGYYKTSKGNIANIGFRQKGSLYTFDQFDLRYNRPDKVLESIGIASERQIAMYTKAYKKRISRMGFSAERLSADVHAPEIQLVAPETLPLTTSANSIEVPFKASDASLHLDRSNVLVNGIPIYGKRGKSLKGSKQKSYEGKVKVPLVAGKNMIQISVMNADGIESIRESYAIECNKNAVKPDLYIVAFGVRTYNDSSMNLTYSDKDAQDLVDLFEENMGTTGLYNKVHVQMLTNNDVLKEKTAETRAVLNNSRIDDQVVLFYSGHGLLDEEMDYFLSTHDVDFANPAPRGLPFEDFRDLIDGIPARNRLILVDACHSGEVDKDEVAHPKADQGEGKTLKTKGFAAKGKKVIGLGNSFELMKELFVELRKESGATIIASSAGKEFSLESDEWKNGVFTFALKEGLLELKADSNTDKKISVSELKRYLFERVKELTDGKQNPTVRRENLQHDYVIY